MAVHSQCFRIHNPPPPQTAPGARTTQHSRARVWTRAPPAPHSSSRNPPPSRGKEAPHPPPRSAAPIPGAAGGRTKRKGAATGRRGPSLWRCTGFRGRGRAAPSLLARPGLPPSFWGNCYHSESAFLVEHIQVIFVLVRVYGVLI